LICINASGVAGQAALTLGAPLVACPACVQREWSMEIRIGDLLVGLLVLVLGLAGLFLASGALDDEIYIFGLGLALFAAVFDIGLVKRHYDRVEAARAEAKHHV
jgi:hypothetical protein